MRLVLVLAAFTALTGAAPAPAGVTVAVRGPNGAPVKDAVVTVHLVGRATPAPQGGGSFTVDQKNIQFHPFVLVVPVNSNVAFPNFDAIRHHVYSFSPAKRFELKLYAREQSRSVRFDKAGIIALGCNIHDQMTAFIDVVDTPWAVKTDASGNAVLGGIPAGQVRITVWHPYLRAPGGTVVKQVALGNAGARESFTVALRSPPRMTGSTHY
jgi:plastocyanin